MARWTIEIMRMIDWYNVIFKSVFPRLVTELNCNESREIVKLAVMDLERSP